MVMVVKRVEPAHGWPTSVRAPRTSAGRAFAALDARPPPRITDVVPIGTRAKRLDLECGHLTFVGPRAEHAIGSFWPCIHCPPRPPRWDAHSLDPGENPFRDARPRKG